MQIDFCNDCLKQVINNLTQEEILLLSEMQKNHIETPQLSCDEDKLISLVDTLTPFKIKFVCARLGVLGLISRTDGRKNKYYINDNGKRLLITYIKSVRNIKSN